MSLNCVLLAAGGGECKIMFIAIHESNATVKFNAIIRGRSLKTLMLL